MSFDKLKYLLFVRITPRSIGHLDTGRDTVIKPPGTLALPTLKDCFTPLTRISCLGIV